ncbi:DUF1236 domain-containing protein [Undibacter mobilis]|uniref:DUF1236 domain-containing protein n=1 Tax=Undibacter mobilis TaxID=2292256 RepID=A0A371B0R3_9BRAD|nr:DUF1236 domain-containing protein [Undibacter mobilis]RDV01165.1 DUF1236 domain-containing protein [Undibacter mobilis]
MQRKTATFLAAIAALAAVALPASAATLATATTSLNIRTGPGPEYPVIGAIPDKGQATVTGCIAGSLWCQVSYNGKQGWAYSQYMMGMAGGQSVVVSQTVPALSFEPPPATVGSTTTVVTTRTIQGEFVAPAGAPLAIAPPPPTVQAYVTQNPVTPVYINGEVVEGAGLPQDVVLTPVPNYEYNYAYVNGVPVLVEPGTRRVTYIYRE